MDWNHFMPGTQATANASRPNPTPWYRTKKSSVMYTLNTTNRNEPTIALRIGDRRPNVNSVLAASTATRMSEMLKSNETDAATSVFAASRTPPIAAMNAEMQKTHTLVTRVLAPCASSAWGESA